MTAQRQGNFLTPVAIFLGGISWLPKFLKQITAMDRLLSRLTRGRWTFVRIAGLTSLMLTVTGRKSGTPRTTPVLCVPYQGGYLIAGSNFGGPTEPIWVLNVRAATTVGVGIDGTHLTCLPRELDGPERDAAWSHMLTAWPNYAKYAERTGRTIPVFLLVPA